MVRFPGQVDVVEGLVANVDVVLTGGAAVRPADPNSRYHYAVPTRTDRAIIDWERSDDGGASWKVVARSYQDEANESARRRRLSVALLGHSPRFRGHSRRPGCAAAHPRLLHTADAVPAPPCVISPVSRINVLQQSALPTIVDAPRSVLVRTGQTANLSATASGLPAPTLQWQTRPANSNGAWSNVTTGTGATTANYTTAATTLADNGMQYRIVATNAVGSAAELPCDRVGQRSRCRAEHHDAARHR